MHGNQSRNWQVWYILSDIGANPSAEEAEENVDDQAKTVLDIAHSFRLQETSFDKKSYLGHLKSLHERNIVPWQVLTMSPAYMKKVKEAMKEKGASEEQVKEFETAAQGYAKKIVANFKDYDFLIGESMDPDGMYGDNRVLVSWFVFFLANNFLY